MSENTETQEAIAGGLAEALNVRFMEKYPANKWGRLVSTMDGGENGVIINVNSPQDLYIRSLSCDPSLRFAGPDALELQVFSPISSHSEIRPFVTWRSWRTCWTW